MASATSASSRRSIARSRNGERVKVEAGRIWEAEQSNFPRRQPSLTDLSKPDHPGLSPVQCSGHERTYRHDHEELLESLVGGKLREPRLGCADDLIRQIGQVQPHGNDELPSRSARSGPSSSAPVRTISKWKKSPLRRFLKEAGVLGKVAKAHQQGRIVVVIDHHAAHLYQDLGAACRKTKSPSSLRSLRLPAHLIHRKEAITGRTRSEEDSYYEEIARDIVHAQPSSSSPCDRQEQRG